MCFLLKITNDPKVRFAAKRLYSFEYVLSEATTGSSNGMYVFNSSENTLHQLAVDFDNTTDSEAKWSAFWGSVSALDKSIENQLYNELKTKDI